MKQISMKQISENTLYFNDVENGVHTLSTITSGPIVSAPTFEEASSKFRDAMKVANFVKKTLDMKKKYDMH